MFHRLGTVNKCKYHDGAMACAYKSIALCLHTDSMAARHARAFYLILFIEGFKRYRRSAAYCDLARCIWNAAMPVEQVDTLNRILAPYLKSTLHGHVVAFLRLA